MNPHTRLNPDLHSPDLVRSGSGDGNASMSGDDGGGDGDDDGSSGDDGSDLSDYGGSQASFEDFEREAHREMQVWREKEGEGHRDMHVCLGWRRERM